jgi:hypothetical protein
MKNDTTMTLPTLTGDELLTKIAEMQQAGANRTEIAHACGYTKDNGIPAFTDFYTAMIKAKGLDSYLIEDLTFEEGTLAAELAERYSQEAVEAFYEYWDVEDLEHFEDAFQGQYESGADFAKELVEGCYDYETLNNLPYWVTVKIDWEDTWDNLSDDFVEVDGFIFNRNW